MAFYQEMDASVPGGMARLGLYANIDGDTLFPGDLIQDLGELSITFLGVKSFDFSPPVVMSANKVYWLVLLCEQEISCNGILNTGQPAAIYPALGFATPASVAPGIGWRLGSNLIGDEWPYADGLPSTWPLSEAQSGRIIESDDVIKAPALYITFTE